MSALSVTPAGLEGQPVFHATGAVCSLSQLNEAAGRSGFLNAAPDADGILRRVPVLMEVEGRQGIAQLFDSPAAPDLCVLHSAAHNWEDQGGHRGEHGGAAPSERAGSDRMFDEAVGERGDRNGHGEAYEAERRAGEAGTRGRQRESDRPVPQVDRVRTLPDPAQHPAPQQLPHHRVQESAPAVGHRLQRPVRPG